MQKKILLMYISRVSGHHAASLAIEHALKNIDPDVRTLNINAFNYTNPVLEKIINKTYMGVVKTKPEVWDYLYDNPNVLKSVKRLRELIHKFNSRLLKGLLDDFKPDAVVCTQAFPCGMVADFKKTYKNDIPLFGVLTDYAPHSYWVYDNIDGYIVPSEETGKRLIENGVVSNRINAFGIPIHPKFDVSSDRSNIMRKIGLEPNVPVILIMGGGQGLGPIKHIVLGLENLKNLTFQVVIVAGTNKKLYRYLKRTEKHRKKKIVYFAFADNIEELMDTASLIITKAGGVTIAEALAKGLPILIVSPLPGQESMNTRYLLSKDIALKANDYKEAVVLVEALLSHPTKLSQMKTLARKEGKAGSAMNTARLILNKIEK